MEERWKPIEGFEEFYEVSDHGRVRKIKQITVNRYGSSYSYKTKVLKGFKNNQGYWQVTLKAGEKRENPLIHRLVARAFIPNPENYPIVNHIDENPNNNNADNLEWCTYKYNSNCGTLPTRRTFPVAAIENGRVIATFCNQTTAARLLNLKTPNINRALRCPGQLCGGFEWSYEKDLIDIDDAI